MVYLKSFEFPDDDAEFDFLLNVKRKCYASFYPFKILSRRRFERIDFEPITMLYGGKKVRRSASSVRMVRVNRRRCMLWRHAQT